MPMMMNEIILLVGWLQIPLSWIKWAKEQGIWDFLTAGAGLFISTIVVSKWRSRIPEFSVYMSYSLATGHPNYPNVLNIEVRNLMDSPIVFGRPNFRFAKGIKAGRFAHGNTATGDYEIKFRPIDSSGEPVPGYSYTVAMLRHRESAYSYLPLNDEWGEEDVFKACARSSSFWRWLPWKKNTGLGTLHLNVVLLKEDKPKVISMRVPVVNLECGLKPPLLGRVWPGTAAKKATTNLL